MMLTTVTLADRPGMPGLSRQVSRMISSTRTPPAPRGSATASVSSRALALSRIRPREDFEFLISRSILSSRGAFSDLGAARILR